MRNNTFPFSSHSGVGEAAVGSQNQVRSRSGYSSGQLQNVVNMLEWQWQLLVVNSVCSSVCRTRIGILDSHVYLGSRVLYAIYHIWRSKRLLARTDNSATDATVGDDVTMQQLWASGEEDTDDDSAFDAHMHAIIYPTL